jgi:hypothetical protein
MWSRPAGRVAQGDYWNGTVDPGAWFPSEDLRGCLDGAQDPRVFAALVLFL